MMNIFFAGKNTEYRKYLNLLKKVDRKIVCVDIDNTICDTNSELAKLGLFDVTKYPAPIPEDFWTSEKGLGIYSTARPIKNTLRIAATLASLGATVTIATKRPPSALATTLNWFIKNKIPQIFYPQDQAVPQIMFVNTKLEAEADIYIEDDPTEIQKLIDNNKIVLVPEWHYNVNLMSLNPQLIYFEIRNQKAS